MTLPPEDQSPGEVFAPSTDEAGFEAVGEHSLENPSYVAFSWWAALSVTEPDDDARSDFYELCRHDGAFVWDYDDARAGIAGLSPVMPVTETAPHLAFMALVDDPGEAMRVTNAAPIEALMVSLVRGGDRTWRVVKVGGSPFLPEDTEGRA